VPLAGDLTPVGWCTRYRRAGRNR